MVPFYDYQKRHPNAVRDLLRIISERSVSAEFILKTASAELENELCAATGSPHAVCVSSATSGMMLALKALSIGPGDEVVTPAFSYISTASAVAMTGATAVFADVDEASFTLSPVALTASLGARSKAVIAAHLFSGLADMPALRQAMPAHLALIEDSATAFGAQMNGKSAGCLGDIGVYSFFPAKPLGGIGDGGAVVSANPALANTVRMLRNHGQDGKTRFTHHLLGVNSRMDEINARWLQQGLLAYPSELARKQAIALRYDEGLAHLGEYIVMQKRNTDEFAPHAYVIRCPERDALADHLLARGIETRVHFAQALPLQPAFAYLDHAPGDFPIAEKLARETLAIPLHAQLSDAEVEQIILAIVEFWR